MQYVSVNLRNLSQAQLLQKHLLTPKHNIMRIKTLKTQKLFKKDTCGEINVLFVVWSVWRGRKHKFSQYQSQGEKTRVFIMGCGSPFGGFVSPFVGFVGFCIWVYFIFFAEITVASSYQWIWLWVHNKEKRKIEILGFREFGYGFTISISPQPYQTLGFSKFFSKSSLYVGKLFFF